MGKLLFWLIVLIGASLAWRTLAARVGKRRNSSGQAPHAAQDTLRCARCGVYFPAAEASLDQSGRSYCCPEHRDAVDAAR